MCSCVCTHVHIDVHERSGVFPSHSPLLVFVCVYLLVMHVCMWWICICVCGGYVCVNILGTCVYVFGMHVYEGDMYMSMSRVYMCVCGDMHLCICRVCMCVRV